MQEFKMSLSEIEDKFTKSEMAMMSYSSREQVLNLEKNSKTTKKKRNKFTEEVEEEQEQDLSPNFYNEEGEIDLRKVTGKEAYRFLSSQGIKIPIVQR
jgi:hypothetical protein